MENTQKEKIGDLGATEKRYEIEKKTNTIENKTKIIRKVLDLD